ncbi:UDP-glucose:glycoprotein glucosyltransferase [Pseudohyphozyma bogoriensis]|nr:UDP-glucose:glycoprotein glucosyltransferase [Pseudohyphozyma bogoriensis]
MRYSLATVLVLAGQLAASSPPLHASIWTSFPAPDFVSLYSESLHLESPSSFFPFLSLLASSPPPASATPQQLYAHLSELSSSLLSSTEKASLDLSLGVREAAPIVEAFRVVAAAAGGDEGRCDGSWIELPGAKVACSVEELMQGLEGAETSAEPTLYTFDHLYPSFSPSTPTPSTLIFYASPSSPSFSALYSHLVSSDNELPFALRWAVPRKEIGGEEKKLSLSGFGAGMDIKKVDYIVIDDRQVAGEGETKEDQEEVVKLLPYPKATIRELPFQTLHYLTNSTTPDRFNLFTTLTSSFPFLAPHLPAPTEYPMDFLDEIERNSVHRLTASGRPSFFLNGIAVPENEVDPFSLLRRMRKERELIESVRQTVVGEGVEMSVAQAKKMLMWKDPEEKKKGRGGVRGMGVQEEDLGELFWAGEVKEEGEEGAVVWWNDLGRDKRYQEWPTNLRELLRPTYPGQITTLAINLHNLVLSLDLSQPDSLSLLTENIRTFVSRGIPIRFGFVPMLHAREEDRGIEEDVARVFGEFVKKRGRKGAMDFLAVLLQHVPVDASVNSHLLTVVYDAFVALPPDSPSQLPLAPLSEVLAEESSFINGARQWGKRLGVTKKGGGQKERGSFFLNGAFFPVDEEFQQNLQRTLQLSIQFLQQKVYLEQVTQETDFDTYFYRLEGAYKYRNQHLFPSADRPLRVVAGLAETVKGKEMLKVYPPVNEEAIVPTATIYVVADFDTVSGLKLLTSAIGTLEPEKPVRVVTLHNPTSAGTKTISSLIYTLRAQDKTPEELLSLLQADGDVSGEVEAEAEQYWSGLRSVVDAFGFKEGEKGLVINGRVFGPFGEGEFEGIEVVKMALQYELVKRIEPTLNAIKSTDFNLESLSLSEKADFYAFATSTLTSATLPDPNAVFGPPAGPREQDYRELDGKYTSIIGANEDSAMFEVAVILDPVSELAQKWAPIVEALASVPSIHVRLYFVIDRYLAEFPVKRFYQYSFNPALRFDAAGEEIQPGVTFTSLPEEVLFTFGMDTQKSWLAFPKSSVHDLDNIRLADLSSSARLAGVKAAFELESIIVEGHARDMPSSQPPRGLQLELQSPSATNGSATVDTICMSNLGYFQLKANPGPWKLAIRQGRSSEVFRMESTGAEGWKTGSVEETGDLLAVTTFEGLTIYPRFKRREGHESTELLDEGGGITGGSRTKGKDSVLGKVSSMFPFLAPYLGQPQKSGIAKAAGKAEINIFTVASGLLYERMAFIMMVSVMRHTKSTVKCWFIQNFLSPSFKAFIPHMAKEYGFDYELITYKWPHWLRAQKEKQRTIWGYKILFLDVLFPLDLDRVIFVDSDQIVRADMKELVDLDLKGAPYGYAPMGSDREETAGFRFWDSGYWKEHLKGRPYHISALYVVDLDRFRQIAAGDRLRQQYQGLSADPNSLANLDQDLPNNMQSTLPIYTLDRDWLWCATWCSDESLATAKTIDLCNNPLTKEPKLARAKRMLPEWTVYDDEVAALAQRVAAESSVSSELDDAVGAFRRRADELVQAVEQKGEFEGARKEQEEKVEEGKERRKDEL